MNFSDLGLSPKVLAAVQAAGYETPTPIQEKAIPFALQGRDILGIAQTGTGKTASFTLPMLTKLERGRARARMPRSLILEPTRELAVQVEQAFKTYGANHKLTMALLIGGVSFGDQDRKLDRGADVLIATPGRLLDHVERGKLMLNGVEVLVIDEADRMLDMGFIPDIERICKLIPFTRQTLFFSATMPPEIQRLTSAFLQNPERIEVSRPSSTSANVDQKLVAADSDPKAKRQVLRDLIRSSEVKNAIIFCNRKRDVALLERSLTRHGFNAGALHGDMDQHARLKTLAGFRDGSIQLLVASDVAARGLDIPEVSHIFNFDVPIHAEDYVHRIGRTARAGKTGHAFSIVTGRDRKHVDAIQKLIGLEIEWASEPVKDGGDSRPGRTRSGRGKDRGESGRGRGAGGRSKNRDTAAAEPVASAAAPAEAGAHIVADTDRPAAAEAKSGRHERDSGKRRGKRDRGRHTDKFEMEEAAAFGTSNQVPAFLRRPLRATK
jgi:superfamily II DNA/RNA helicase